MSILKRKALVAHQRYVLTHYISEIVANNEDVNFNRSSSETMLESQKKPEKTRVEKVSKPKANVKAKSSTNVVKNYSRALVTFSNTTTAVPYLDKILDRHGLSYLELQRFIEHDGKKVNCIKRLRQKLLVAAGDSDKVAKCKATFQELCVIFLKFFSVNWIYNSRISDKQSHLMHRFKMLRRIRNPEHFMYLESPR